ncbi:hypothetical protein [Thalassomonas actiniarum]|uniref:Uncharacterized protein n=1 Tax=Thalassomonas actiniarum TaxID=485447 RepID=A0AAF0C6G3_9GAMM|nr:hypothetical protein [Thalassomonas actiniarum]WDE02236.1 hypothetical protein SG35_031260 [Thalassomonas actiniarum]
MTAISTNQAANNRAEINPLEQDAVKKHAGAVEAAYSKIINGVQSVISPPGAAVHASAATVAAGTSMAEVFQTLSAPADKTRMTASRIDHAELYKLMFKIAESLRQSAKDQAWASAMAEQTKKMAAIEDKRDAAETQLAFSVATAAVQLAIATVSVIATVKAESAAAQQRAKLGPRPEAPEPIAPAAQNQPKIASAAENQPKMTSTTGETFAKGEVPVKGETFVRGEAEVPAKGEAMNTDKAARLKADQDAELKAEQDAWDVKAGKISTDHNTAIKELEMYKSLPQGGIEVVRSIGNYLSEIKRLDAEQEQVKSDMLRQMTEEMKSMAASAEKLIDAVLRIIQDESRIQNQTMSAIARHI